MYVYKCTYFKSSHDNTLNITDVPLTELQTTTVARALAHIFSITPILPMVFDTSEEDPKLINSSGHGARPLRWTILTSLDVTDSKR